MSNLISVFGKKVAIVTAHPDDESFVFAGLARGLVVEGAVVDLYCMTMGEQGRAYIEITEQGLKELRSSELEAAVQIIGMNLVYLGSFPDGSLYKKKQELSEKLRSLLIGYQSIIGFGSEGFTGHSDHVTMNEVAKVLADEMEIPYYCACLPHGENHDIIKSALLRKRHCDFYEDCEELDLPEITIKIDSEIKLKALKAHTSQFSGLDPYGLFDRSTADDFLNFEYYCKNANK